MKTLNEAEKFSFYRLPPIASPEAACQRCYVHFLRNALDHLPRKANDDCLTELRWLYDRRDAAEARQHLRRWLERLNQEIKHRTHVIRIFPNDQSCLRLIRALASEQHEEWLDGPVYLDMQPLRDLLKPSHQLAA